MSNISPAAIDADRIDAASRCIERCHRIAGCTDVMGNITRTFLSPAMAPVHAMLQSWMVAAGMQTRVDAAGNLIGTLPATSADSQPPPIFLMGSHLDTVPNAGRYDGVLGVMIALAVAEVLQKTNRSRPFQST